MADPQVTAVVLNWNGREDTLACLESLAASDYGTLRTIVVDNGSTDGTAEAVTARFPGADVVRLAVNVGYAGGMNAGIERALALGADYVLVLNNDTEAEPDLVSRLVAAAAAHPQAGILQPLIMFADLPHVVWNAGFNIDPRRGYWGKPIGDREPDRGQFAGVREVDAATGCAMLLPAAALHDVGGFDADLFAYIEDIDLSLRVRAAGYRVMVVGDARLRHKIGSSGGGEYSPLFAYYSTRNRFVVCARHAPLSGSRAVLRDAEILVTNLVHARRARRPLRNARAVIAAWRDYRRGRLGPRA